MSKKTPISGYPFAPALLGKVPTLLNYPVRVRRIQRGQAVVCYQEPIRELQFLVEGRAKVFSMMENGRAVMHTLFQGFEVIGDLEFLRGYPLATTDVRAVTDVTLLVIPLEECREQLWDDAPMLRLLGGELAKKLERSSRKAAQNLIYSLAARLASYMVFSAQDDIFSENLTQTCELLVTSYRHLLRTLKIFCESGAICRTARGYHILDASLFPLGEEVFTWDSSD